MLTPGWCDFSPNGNGVAISTCARRIVSKRAADTTVLSVNMHLAK
jgi:hypothetical protein